MLQSIKELYGNKLGARDGDIGHVKDFYFDDQSWAVRYVIADTGNWLPGRLVLLAPHSLAGLVPVDKVLGVNLTRKQIEDSPSTDLHQPVSRQYEAKYYRYFGWPYYWQGDQLWGLSGFPGAKPSEKNFPREPSAARDPKGEGADAHLRSAQSVSGYHLQASDGITGHVCDFLMDDKSWAVAQLVIKTGHRFSGKEVLIPTGKVNRISYEESTVFVNLTKEAVEQSPEYDLAGVAV